jgi:hypothetical protein
MRPVLLASALAALAALLAATVRAQPATGFAFGRSGGDIMPFRISISTAGVVTTAGPTTIGRRRLTKLQLAELNRVAFLTSFSTLPVTTSCPGTLPDIASRFIRVGPHTVRVHGSCVPRFNRLWAALARETA